MTPPLTAFVEALRDALEPVVESTIDDDDADTEIAHYAADESKFNITNGDVRRIRAALSAFEAEPQEDPFASVEAYIRRNERIVAKVLAGWTEQQRLHMLSLAQPLPLPPETNR